MLERFGAIPVPKIFAPLNQGGRIDLGLGGWGRSAMRVKALCAWVRFAPDLAQILRGDMRINLGGGD